MPKLGTVYLIHFDKPYKHAKHYRGFCEGDVEDRFITHLNSNGARLLKVLNEAGIGYSVVRVWTGVTRQFERALKKKSTHSICPICNPKLTQYLYEKNIKET